MTTTEAVTVRTLSEESIPFFAGARSLVGGDVEATLLLCALAHLARRESDGWVRASASEIEDLTALSRRRQERARRVLSTAGLLLEKLGGMPASLRFRVLVSFDEKGKQDPTEAPILFRPPVASVSTEAGSMVPPKGNDPPPSSTYEDLNKNNNKKKKATKPLASLAPRLSVTAEEVARGALDDEDPRLIADREEVALLALSWWAKVWAKREGSVALTAARRKAWKTAFAVERRKPSEFFTAIVGMTHDPWAERDAYCDWTHLLRALEKWSEVGARARLRPALRPSALGFPVKDVAGVTVPEGYDWQGGDDFCRSRGERFDPRTKEWVRKEDERWWILGVLNRPVSGGR